MRGVTSETWHHAHRGGGAVVASYWAPDDVQSKAKPGRPRSFYHLTEERRFLLPAEEDGVTRRDAFGVKERSALGGDVMCNAAGDLSWFLGQF